MFGVALLNGDSNLAQERKGWQQKYFAQTGSKGSGNAIAQSDDGEDDDVDDIDDGDGEYDDDAENNDDRNDDNDDRDKGVQNNVFRKEL